MRLINADDLIERINAVIEHGLADPDGLHPVSAEVFLETINVIPSAQPEIIYCKDCKHWIPYDWMFSEMWQSRNIADYPEDEIGCKYCDMSMKANDFCSRAERREVTK